MSKLKFSLGIALQLLLTTSMFIIGWYISSTKASVDKSVKTTELATYTGIKAFINHQSGYSNVSTSVATYHSEASQSDGYLDTYHPENDNSVNSSNDEFEYKARFFGELIVMLCAFALLLGVCFQLKQRYDQTHLAA
jgi:hypothetical protein